MAKDNKKQVSVSGVQRILSVVALIGLVACGVMIGVAISKKQHNTVPQDAGMQMSKRDCRDIISRMTANNTSAEELMELNKIYNDNCAGRVFDKPVVKEEVKDVAVQEGGQLKETCLVVEEALLELIMDYASREGALEIDDENGYILQVKQDHLDIVEKLCPVELRPSVLKTLTVIALKEPIRQSYLKELRGSNAYDHVAELLEKGLISRHKDKNGRSFNIKTTTKFNEYFKLKGDVRSLVKTLNIDAGVKDEPGDDDAPQADEVVLDEE
jgi:segregation and condensation protein B